MTFTPSPNHQGDSGEILTDEGDEESDKLLVGASSYRVSISLGPIWFQQSARTNLAPSIGSAGRSNPTSEKPYFSIKYFKTVRFPAEGVPTIAINILAYPRV